MRYVKREREGKTKEKTSKTKFPSVSPSFGSVAFRPTCGGTVRPLLILGLCANVIDRQDGFSKMNHKLDSLIGQE